jgi:hypothetical protein
MTAASPTSPIAQAQAAEAHLVATCERATAVLNTLAAGKVEAAIDQLAKASLDCEARLRYWHMQIRNLLGGVANTISEASHRLADQLFPGADAAFSPALPEEVPHIETAPFPTEVNEGTTAAKLIEWDTSAASPVPSEEQVSVAANGPVETTATPAPKIEYDGQGDPRVENAATTVVVRCPKCGVEATQLKSELCGAPLFCRGCNKPTHPKPKRGRKPKRTD